MAHHLYYTEGYIVSKIDIKETDTLFRIFTKDLGLIFVVAKNTRALNSKLRYRLKLFTHNDFYLVLGRETWRLVGVELTDFPTGYYREPIRLNKTAKVFDLLKIFIHGEEANEPLFGEIKNGLTFLSNPALAREDFVYFDFLMTLRVLRHLGYLKDTNMFRSALDAPVWGGDILRSFRGHEKEATELIDKAFFESGLAPAHYLSLI